MAHIVMADDGIPFDGQTPEKGPLGGAESAFVSLANALAARGHRVDAFSECDSPLSHQGVEWRPRKSGMPDQADLYIANRSDKLIRAVPNATKRIFWIHNPAGYLLKFRYLWKLAATRPAIVFSGDWHAASCPGWVPSSARPIIPYGISEMFRSVVRGDVPKPVAIFTSNPLRGLDWLLDIWREKIHPECPEAELHLYSGAATYGAHGATLAGQMKPVLDKAVSMKAEGVRLFDPVAKEALAEIYANARVMIYRGDPGETYCLAVGEAQATGLPAIVQDIGCVAERVVDNETGFVAPDDATFAAHAVKLLGDDVHWQQMSKSSLKNQRSWGWDDAAAAFEKLIPA